ncbi:MAG TPA: amylo-alpha-1,6-glucosidase [Candidatus Polarisedimenticolaceae bacterium]|nr:amylo-alpha-1,6-glucosidase [Candidatus Polarisedimenticolaceae bacterium]
MRADERNEWLEADGLGGFASGTASGIRTRRYHALLLVATTPPSGRYVLVNGIEAWARTADGDEALTSQRYAPGVVHPDGAARIESFASAPWPSWVFRLRDGCRIRFDLFVPHETSSVVLSWRADRVKPPLELFVRPLLSGRDPHALHRENTAFRFEPAPLPGGGQRWAPYPDVPAIYVTGNGEYDHSPDWYRNFVYEQERLRGLDFIEDLASPGVFRWDLARGPASLSFSADEARLPGGAGVERERRAERRRRRRFPSELDRSADAYLVRRGTGKTIVAGYPWFGDWGRDTFISLRGLCLTTGRLDDAGRILREWARAVSNGMLPNRFPDRGEAPEYNSVDASLWYVIAVHEFLEAVRRERGAPSRLASELREAVDAILEGYARGTRYRIGMDRDGLLASGEPGVQLTWMDAKVGDRVITPRTGKPVEVQALWLNALAIGASWNARWRGVLERGSRSLTERFWNPANGMLYDVVDVDHVAGSHDAAVRPNQILTVGGLPRCVLDSGRARSVVDGVERRLLTPLGLRSLAPDEAGYAARYEGGVAERDGAYHQGTVWPWLLGPFVEAWVRVRGGSTDARRQASRRFLAPVERHLRDAGSGHVSEITDAEDPYTPRGCPFQAWSLGELLRLSRQTLEVATETGPVAGVAK